MTNSTNTRALLILQNTKHRLTTQQYKTLRGQILAGDADGAMRGLKNVLQRRAERMASGRTKKRPLVVGADNNTIQDEKRRTTHG